MREVANLSPWIRCSRLLSGGGEKDFPGHVVSCLAADLPKLDSLIRVQSERLSGRIGYYLVAPGSTEDRDYDCFGDWADGWVVSHGEADDVELLEAVRSNAERIAAPVSVGGDTPFQSAGLSSLNFVALYTETASRTKIRFGLQDLLKFNTARLFCWRIQALSLTADSNSDVEVVEDIEGYVPANRLQSDIYAAARLHPSKRAYCTPILLRLATKPPISAVRSFLKALTDNNAALRSVFRLQAGQLYQRTSRSLSVPLVVRRVDDTALIAEIDREICELDLERGPLVRASLLTTQTNEIYLLFNIHHIVIDGYSGILIAEALDAHLSNQEVPAVTNYRSVQIREETARQTSLKPRAHAYWHDLTQGADFEFRPPARRDDSNWVAGQARTLSRRLTSNMCGQLDEYAIECGVTHHVLLLSAVLIAMGRYVDRTDIAVGVPTSSRQSVDAQRTLGMFVATLPACHNIGEGKSFETVVAEVQRGHLNRAVMHAAGWPEIHRQRGRNLPGLSPFSVAFVSQDYPSLAKTSAELLPIFPDVASFEIAIHAVSAKGGRELLIQYSDELYPEDFIKAFCESIISVLRQGIQSKYTVATCIPLSEPDVRAGQSFISDMDTPDLGQRIPDRFRKMREIHGASPALVDQHQEVTYDELDISSDLIASRLTEFGVRPGDIVPILADRSVEYVTSMLGILKAGATYLPLDSSYPVGRLNGLIVPLQPRIILNACSGRSFLSSTRLFGGSPVVDVRMLLAANHNSLGKIIRPSNDVPPDVAYIMYTSGSTGEPKGVLVTHRNILRTVVLENVVPLTAETRFLLTGSPAFDATTYEIWGALLNGGSVALVGSETLLDPPTLKAAIHHFLPNTMWLTAPLFAQLAAADPTLFDGLEYLIAGGDVIPPETVKLVHQANPSIVIVNGYGPTENTVFSTMHAIRRGEEGPIPVGRPLSGSKAFVLDRDRNVLPAGAIGELWVGGSGVASGYHQVDEKGAFTDVTWPDGSQDRMYRTGDVASLNFRGEILLHGRNDDQIKINGVRIEIAEVLRAVQAHPLVQQARIEVQREGSQAAMICYAVGEGELSIEDLRAYLSAALPSAMIPRSIHLLERFPLTPNGKIDGQALSVSVMSRLPTMHIADGLEEEQAIAKAWHEVLGSSPSSAETSFFEAGGTSLKIIHLWEVLERILPGQFSVPDLFQYGSIKDQALFLRRARQGNPLAMPNAMTPEVPSPMELLRAAREKLESRTS